MWEGPLRDTRVYYAVKIFFCSIEMSVQIWVLWVYAVLQNRGPVELKEESQRAPGEPVLAILAAIYSIVSMWGHLRGYFVTFFQSKILFGFFWAPVDHFKDYFYVFSFHMNNILEDSFWFFSANETFFDVIPQKNHHFPFGNTPKMALCYVLSTEEHIYSFFFCTSLTELIVLSSFLLLKHAQQVGGFSSAPSNLKKTLKKGIFRVVRWKSNMSRHRKCFHANF